MVGIDIEWQPTFGAQLARAAVLQIATREQVFLFDIFSLRQENPSVDQSRDFVRHVFENPHLLKLGFGMKEDLQVLGRSLPGLEDVNKLLRKWLDLRTLWSVVQSKYPSICSTSGISIFSLIVCSFDLRDWYIQ